MTESKARACHAAYIVIQRALVSCCHRAAVEFITRRFCLRMQEESSTCLLASSRPPRNLTLHVYIMNIYQRPRVSRCDGNTHRFHGTMYLDDFDLMTRWYLSSIGILPPYFRRREQTTLMTEIAFRVHAREREVAHRFVKFRFLEQAIQRGRWFVLSAHCRRDYIILQSDRTACDISYRYIVSNAAPCL